MQGLVVQSYVDRYSHHAATRSLGAWLEAEGVPGITGIDTRTLTRRLREHGTMKGWLLPAADDPARARNAAETVDMKEEVFRLVAPDNVIRYEGGPLKVLLVDAGAKDNMVRSLLKRGASVVRAPWHADLAPLAAECDGILIGNGPGDPKDLMPLVEQVRSLLRRLPQAHLRHLPGPPDPRARRRRRHLQAALRPPRREPAGAGPAHAALLHHQPEPRLRRAAGSAARRLGALVRQRERRHQRGHPRPHPPVLQRAVPPRGLARTRRHGLPFRRLPAPRRRGGEGVTMYGAYLPRKPRKVLVLGSGALQIGQAGEFDYSGTQAIKALKEEGIATVLINPEHRHHPDQRGAGRQALPHRGHAGVRRADPGQGGGGRASCFPSAARPRSTAGSRSTRRASSTSTACGCSARR